MFRALSLRTQFSVIARNFAKPSEATGLNLAKHGINVKPTVQVFRNLDYAEIHKHEVADGNQVTALGAVTVDTGKFTGRSPKDKYFVDQKPSTDNVSPMSLLFMMIFCVI
jgi:ATP-dependent phosphoenolpyruvate carboxykinase